MRRHLLIFASLLALSLPAKAADSTVSAMTAASAFGGTELLYIVQGAADRKGTPAQMATYVYGLMSGDCTVTAGAITCTKVNGVTFPSSFTSGGIPYASSSSAISSSAALTANLPVVGGGAGAAPAVGTRSGNTTAFVTTTGTQTSGDCVKIDASGNHIANGSACGGGGTSSLVSTYITGGTQYYTPFYGMAPVSGTVFTANTTAYCSFGTVAANVTIKALQLRLATGVASSNLEFAIYSFATPPTNTMTLVDTTAQVASTSSASNPQANMSNTTDTLNAGTLYAFCAASSGAIAVTSFASASGVASSIIGSATALSVTSAGASVIGRSFGVTYSATPSSTFPGTLSYSAGTDITANAATAPMIAFLVN